MFSRAVMLPAAAVALLLSAPEVQAQARLQNRQSAGCQQNGGQGQATARQELRALQNALQRLAALQQSGQLSAAQLQTVNQLQSALQESILLSGQLRALGQQQDALQAAQLLGRR